MSERCSRDKVISDIDAIRKEEERAILMKQEVINAELADFHLLHKKPNLVL